MRLLIAFALVLAACKSDKPVESKPEEPAAKPAAPPEPTAPAQTGVTATVDGKPVGIVSAFAWKSADSVVTLTALNRPSSCEEVTANMREVKPGEESFSAAIAQTLQPDGAFKAALAQVSYSGNTRAGSDAGSVELTGDPTPGATVKIKVGFEIENYPWRDTEVKKKLKVDGTIEALGCTPPARPVAGAPAAPAPQAARITVAGHEVKIAGSVLEQKPDGRTLVLASGAASCEGFASGDGDVIVILRYKDKDDVWQADLMGRWFGPVSSVTQIFDKGRPTAKPSRAPDGATTVDIALGGTVDINGYPVALAGKVAAQVCPPK